MRKYITALISCITIVTYSQKQTPAGYIDSYKDLAVIEMYRSGVPASITLAQGILESSSGNSRLAQYANNHFGIKCKGNWTGTVIYADDDAPNECFRAYSSVLESFQDHSDFLRTNWRYHPLFELHVTDYRGWCEGLRKAGYATNNQYHTILINLIEKYELYKFDRESLPGQFPELLTTQRINDIPVTVAKPGETAESIAKQLDLKGRHIKKWNDIPEGSDIKAGDVVYLKPKRRRGSADNHIVEEGESMWDISQKYGIKLKILYRKNRMTPGSQPQAGQKIEMQSKRSSEDPVKMVNDKPQWQEKHNDFVNPHTINASESEIDFSHPGPIGKVDEVRPETHVVAVGDNIYRIAEKYKIFEEDILAWNIGLNPLTMKVGQIIKLTPPRGYDANATKSPAKPIVEAQKVNDPPKEDASKKIVITGPIYHKVEKGDTMFSLCRKYNITIAQLKAWNNLATDSINLDQKLKVSE